jgi:hypothetical protein
VNPDANPDYKQVFDCGLTLPPDDPLTSLPAYAPNLWVVSRRWWKFKGGVISG